MSKTDTSKQVLLTGIKPTGTPHIGNYLGAIEPSLELVNQYDQGNLFIADYHALNTTYDGELIKKQTYLVAATWIAAGLDTDKFNLYRQSDVPEVFELATILTNFTPKGWMNKAHAYKAAVDLNTQNNKDPDEGINMGLYTYPLLMASDILLFNADVIPVGKDQAQHVEIARDIAQRFNHAIGDEIITLPEHLLKDEAKEVVGVDGRKMSKSYDNIIPLFTDKDGWWEAVRKIVTDSSSAGEQLVAEDSLIYQIFTTLADAEQSQALKSDLESGNIGWKEAKERLLEVIVDRFGPMSEKYHQLINSSEQLDEVLRVGAEKVRPIAQDNLNKIKQAVLGLNP